MRVEPSCALEVNAVPGAMCIALMMPTMRVEVGMHAEWSPQDVLVWLNPLICWVRKLGTRLKAIPRGLSVLNGSAKNAHSRWPAFSTARLCTVRHFSRALLRLRLCRLRCIQRVVLGPSTSTQGSTCLTCRLHSDQGSACALG